MNGDTSGLFDDLFGRVSESLVILGGVESMIKDSDLEASSPAKAHTTENVCEPETVVGSGAVWSRPVLSIPTNGREAFV